MLEGRDRRWHTERYPGIASGVNEEDDIGQLRLGSLFPAWGRRRIDRVLAATAASREKSIEILPVTRSPKPIHDNGPRLARIL
jgi:hypothetical protein